MALRKLNIRQENKSKLKINAEEIPDLVPKKVLKEWMAEDSKPYYKIEAIDYPIIANRFAWKESFFEEYISKLKERPIPGTKSGHEMREGVRPPTDFIVIGAKLQKAGDGKGTVFLKNYIPPHGESGDNTIFIRENKSDMIHFSLVSYTKDLIEEDENGDQIINVIGSVKGERNDAVEYGMGAMDQKTNEDKNAGVAGDDNNYIGVIMNKDELLKKLKAFKVNGDITLLEVAKYLGCENQLITEEHKTAMAQVAEFKKLKIEKPVEQFVELKKRMEDNDKLIFNGIITAEFGPEKYANKKENLLRQYCVSQLKNVQIDELVTKIEEVKQDPIALKLAGEHADFMSDTNTIGRAEKKKTNQNDTEEKEISGTKVDKV